MLHPSNKTYEASLAPVIFVIFPSRKHYKVTEHSLTLAWHTALLMTY